MIRSRSLFLLTLSLLISVKSRGDDFLSPSSSPVCPSYQCGNVTVKYPFWSIDRFESDQVFCGYPDFGLACRNGEAILRLPGDSYYVTDINYTNNTITLVDIDAVNPRVDCPRARHNLTIGTLPLGYSNLDSNISFYFNCSSNLPTGLPIDCLSSDGLRSFVIVTTNGGDAPEWYGICQENVVVTVMETHISGYDLATRFAAAMNSGFVLDWRVLQDCRECEASKGYCAHSNSTGEFFCICNEERRARL